MGNVRRMYQGVCSICGATCEVPFEPIEGRPIKCKSCFLKFKNKRRFKKRDFEVICDECGKHTTVPFKPVTGDPVYCRDCFDRKNESGELKKGKVDPPNGEEGREEQGEDSEEKQEESLDEELG